MKKFLFTLAALFMAGSALADSGFYFGEFDESTLGTTNESTLTLTQDDLAGEYEMYLKAYWSARISGTECVVTYPEGMTVVFAEPGADATVNTLNGRGRPATETASFSGMVEPFDHFVTLFSTAGYYKDEEGNIVTYGVNKWEAGYYEEMGIFYVEFDEGFQGGDIVVVTNVASGKDPRGGTVRENGEHSHDFTFTCHVVVEGAVPPTPVVAPVPAFDWNEETFTMTAACEDHEVVMMIGDEEVANPYTVEQTLEEQTITFKAYTVAAEGEDENSEVVEMTVTVPARDLVVAPEPTMTWDEGTFTMTAACEDHEVVLMIGDEVVANPYTIEQTLEEQTITFKAYTVAAEGEDENSAVVEQTVVVPARDLVVAPEPTMTWNEETFTMEATCEDHEVVLMIGDEVVANPYTVEQTDVEQVITFKAYTVAAEGEDENSEAVEQTVTVPAKEVVTPDLPGYIIVGAPAANGEFYVNYMPGDYEGDYEIVVTINDEVVEANENGTYQAVEGENHVVVTVIANGYNNKVAENTFNYHYPTTAPAPEFVWNEETFTMEAVCEGHEVVLYMNGTEVENPYTVEQTDVEQTITFSAMTVAADEDNNSAVVYAEPVVVPAKEVVVTPPAMPTYEVTYDDDFMYITFACEEGAELTIYDEDGQEVAENPVKIARPEYNEAADPVYVHYTATATVDGVVSETLYVNEKVEQKAQEVGPEDPHAKGWWIVLTDINGEEVWYELHEGTDGSWVTTVTLNYGEYGTFYWDPELSAEENNVNRPNVPYHFVVDGQVWGAPEADQATLMGEAANTMSNPLYENANNYTVPVGYSYVLGIYVDPSETDQLGDGTFYYVYCAQGPQTDVDELNAAKTVAGVRYFNLAGQEMQEANGMTIVVTTYTDGTTSAVKVMK